VPKYDAFGREIGEDTLAGLGGGPAKPAEESWQDRIEGENATWEAAERVETARVDTAADAAEDARQAAAGEQRFTAPAAEPQRQKLAAQLSSALSQAQAARASGAAPKVTVTKQRSAGRGCLVALIVLLAVGGALVAGIVGAVNSVDIKGTVDSIKSAVPETPQTPEPAPKGLGTGSLVRQKNFADALAKIAGSEGGRLTTLRLAPERIDATLLTKDGRLRIVQVKPGGKLEQLGSDSGPGFDQTSTIPYSRLSVSAPQRLARRGAKEIGVPVSTLQYLVPTSFSGKVTWAAYFEHGRYVIGDSRGRFDRAYP
jgi:hypothetical protein